MQCTSDRCRRLKKNMALLVTANLGLQSSKSCYCVFALVELTIAIKLHTRAIRIGISIRWNPLHLYKAVAREALRYVKLIKNQIIFYTLLSTYTTNHHNVCVKIYESIISSLIRRGPYKLWHSNCVVLQGWEGVWARAHINMTSNFP